MVNLITLHLHCMHQWLRASVDVVRLQEFRNTSQCRGRCFWLSQRIECKTPSLKDTVTHNTTMKPNNEVNQRLCFLCFSSLLGTPADRGLKEVSGWVPQGAENLKIGRKQGLSIASAPRGTPLARSSVTDAHLKTLTLTPPPAGLAWV